MSKNYVVIKKGNQECIPITEKKAVIGLEDQLSTIEQNIQNILNNPGGSGNSNAVLYTQQNLTEGEKQQARQNIGAYAKPNGGIPADDLAHGVLDVSGKEDVSNKVTNWSSTTTDTHYPSEKLVKDSLGNKQDTLVSGINIKTINGKSILGSGDITVGSGGVLVQEQADWNESSSSSPSYIQNKPTNLEVTSNKVTNKSQFTNSLTNDQYLSARVVYEIVGDVESLLRGL